MNLPGLRFDERPEFLDWRRTKVPGVSWIPLHLDDEEGGRADAPAGRRARRRRGAATVLIRMEPGCAYTPHRHVGSEDVLVLAGAYTDDRGTHRRGDHVHYPAGSVHAPRALGDPERPIDESNPACVLYSTVPEGIELLPGQHADRSTSLG